MSQIERIDPAQISGILGGLVIEEGPVSDSVFREFGLDDGLHAKVESMNTETIDALITDLDLKKALSRSERTPSAVSVALLAMATPLDLS